MGTKRIPLWNSREYDYPRAGDFVPELHTYLHETETPLPCVIVVPGGAYAFVSQSEASLPAKRLHALGYQTLALTYTVNPTGDAPLRQQPMRDLSRAIRLIRSRAEALGVDPNRIAVCGFSAGAHLCASLAAHFQDITDPDSRLQSFSNRPDAVILGYPVITTGEYAHRGSVEALLGENPTPEELEYYSIETQVEETFPPCFLWQTATDDSVPVENSYLLAMALRRAGVPFAHHVFSDGVHGLSTADEAMARRDFGEDYAERQLLCLSEAAARGEVTLPGEAQRKLSALLNRTPRTREANPEAAVWPELADMWLRKSLR